MKKKLIASVLALFTIISFVGCGSQSTSKSQNEKKDTKTSNTGYSPTNDENNVLSKHYYELTDNEKETFKNLENKYDSLSDNDKTSIKDRIEKLRDERKTIEENQKLIKENMQTYADFIKEVESNYPSMKVHDISGKDKAKDLAIDMKLLNNLDATYYECAKLTLDKETRMKEVGIEKIEIFVNDKNGENQGILSFELESGKYKSKINTFSR
ncbi:hypothetical protein [Clostridium beijerinckii]|uniref:hypothetical protein n=1 Tax=Clostridium beijerinckii TaxID=1520 RepID=UPI002330299E|nr:hypothetical protein [Clostridium beijerinckii]